MVSRIVAATVSLLSVTWPMAGSDPLITGALVPEAATVIAAPEGTPFAPAVIPLSGDVPLMVSFDLRETDRRYLRYSLTHCDASWRPDNLMPIEFTHGFNEGRIDDFAYSQATLTPYVNYRFMLPNDEVAPTVSGNYIITVYDEEKPDSPLLRVPFMVTEQSVRVGASSTSRTDYDYNGAHQQLEVSVDFTGLDVRDPWNDLKVTVIPNGQPAMSRTVSRPMRVNGSSATFSHAPELTFPAGKEYRRFETVSTQRYLPMGVELLAFQEPYYHFKLYDDEPRAGRDYEYDRTQYGAFAVNADNSDDPDTEAEYVMVHFSLDFPEQPEARIVIEGDLTGRRTDALSPGVMTFNRVTNRYEKVLTLKQGSYNYRYLLVGAGDTTPLTGPVEGDDYRTSNRYDIAVYYHRPGDRYDRLLGFTSIYSGI